MKYLYSIIFSVLIVFLMLFLAYRFMPFNFIEPDYQPKVGSTITTINGGDTLSGSRSVINTNFANLNLGKVENSTTSMSSITTLLGLTSATALSSVGTITTGTWTGTAIAVLKGGSGTTTPSRYQVILGNGLLGFTVASSTGTTGQFLTSNGAGAYPSWQTSTINQTDPYLWTGTHNFIGTTLIKTLNASSTLVIGEISYVFPNQQAVASTTVLANNGSGNLVWMKEGWQQLGETTLSSDTDTISVTIPARKDLVVKIYIASTTVDSNTNLNFNSDSGANYAYRRYTAYATVSDSASASQLSYSDGIAAASSSYATMNIANPLNGPKIMDWTVVYGSRKPEALPKIGSGVGTWDSLAQITTIVATAQSGNFKAGSRMTVYGKQD